MITKDVINEVAASLQVTPMNHNILVLVPSVKETTDSGIIKGDQVIEEERKKQDVFLHVIAVADDVESVVPGDRIFVQGNVYNFSDEMLPDELRVDIDGYTIGTTLDMYVKMKM